MYIVLKQYKLLQTLNYDILNLIFNIANNKNIIFVDKECYNIAVKHKCGTCGKITNISGHNIWLTEEDDYKCHTHYLEIKLYKMIDVQIKIDYKNKDNLYNIIKGLRLIGYRKAYLQFKGDDSKMSIHLKGATYYTCVKLKSSIFNKFVCTKKSVCIELNLKEFYNIIFYGRCKLIDLYIYNEYPDQLGSRSHND